MTHSFTVWKLAAEPNYKTNIDQDFPYSGLPHQGEYRLLKIPVSLNNLIKHIDYFGEGRVESTGGIRGFPNCYNVNHQYRLVSSGPDKDKKIPSRIPVLSYTDCDTSVYIKDNSVLTVTVAGEHINSSCTKDIARIINKDLGKVVVYGVHGDSQEISELTIELKKKSMFLCVDATLSNELQALTHFDGHVAFLNRNEIRTLKDELYNNVVNGNYESAVNISRSFVIAGLGEDLNVVVQKLISEAPRNVVFFAYKLWHGGSKDVVCKHFPNPFQYIINEDTVTIVNKNYDQALKLDSNPDPKNNDRAVWGDKRLPKGNDRLSWKFLPACKGNDLTFKLYNIDCNMFMRMDDVGDYVGDKQCWGSTKNKEDLDDDRYKYYLEPVIVTDADPVFLITNVHQKQGLKLEVKQDEYGDRLLWGHNGTVHDENDRYRWIITNWSSSQSLKQKAILPCVDASRPNELQSLTYSDKNVASLNSNEIPALKEELYNNVLNGNYESAVNISRSFVTGSVGENLNVVVHKLLSEAPRNVVFFAYKLWHGGAKDVVRKHFPNSFQYIINEDTVTIVNKRYDQALKLDSNPDPKNNDRAIWGDRRLPKGNGRLSWKFLPACKGNDLTFKLYNIDCNMFMRMDDVGDYVGDKQCWGSTKNKEDLDDDRYKYYLEPVIVTDADPVFLITNVHQKQGLKLEVKQDVYGDRLLWGHNGNVHDENDRYRWVITNWSSSQSLKQKAMFPCVDASLPNEFQGLTYSDKNVASLNSNEIRALKDELYNNVLNGNYECAVNISRSFVTGSVGEDLNVVVQKLLSEAPWNVVFFAYKLWHGGAKDVVRKHFPNSFQYIINEDTVTIVNKRYDQALKLDSNPDPKNNDRAVWGDKRLPKANGRLSWKFLPTCKGNDLTFKLYNIDCNMFIRMDNVGDYVGDKQCWGSTKNKDPEDDRYKYYLEPVIVNDADPVFLIINVHQKQGLKLEVKQDEYGDRLLWGHNGNVRDENDRYRWVINNWSSSQSLR